MRPVRISENDSRITENILIAVPTAKYVCFKMNLGNSRKQRIKGQGAYENRGNARADDEVSL